MSVYRREGSPYWFYDFTVGGVRFRGTTEAKDKRTAEVIEGKLRQEVLLGQHFKKKPSMTLNEAFGRYYEEVARHQASAQTTFYLLSNIQDRMKVSQPLCDIADSDLSIYVSKRRSEVTNASVNREVELMRRIWRRADTVWKVDIGEMPNWQAHRLPEAKVRRRYLSDDEEVRLMAAAEEIRPDMIPMIRFCLLTGVRVSNARDLLWSDVDYEAGSIRMVVKGDEYHDIPLFDDLLVLLANERDRHQDHVFTYECKRSRGQRGKGKRYPYSKNGWRKEWVRILEKAKIDDFRFHDLRHSAATRMLQATGKLAVVRDVLGHKSITTTERYAHVLHDDMRSAMEAAARHKYDTAGEAKGKKRRVSAGKKPG